MQSTGEEVFQRLLIGKPQTDEEVAMLEQNKLLYEQLRRILRATGGPPNSVIIDHHE